MEFGIKQAIPSAVGGYVLSSVITLYVELSIQRDILLPYFWLALLWATLFIRNQWLRRTRDAVRGKDVVQLEQVFAVSAIILACVMALLPALMLPDLSPHDRLFFTTVLCLWVAGAMASLGARPWVFITYASVVVLGLGIGWLRSDDPLTWPLLGLMVLYLAVLTSFARHLSRVVTEGIRIRHANERLVKELELANEAKSRFILTASHDLRQPLHALSLLSGALGSSPTPAQMQAATQGIRQSVQALVQLLSAVLDISKMDAQAVQPRLRPVFLPELVGQLAREYALLCQDKGLRWQSQLLPLTLRTDPAMLERLLRNLLDNALKHGGQGPVGIGMTLGEELVITVSDHGPGIPAAERERVFEEFYRLPQSGRAGGLGLGLSIVRRLAGLLGYRLQIADTEAEPTKGTQFRIYIPRGHVLSETAPVPQVPPAAEPGADLRGLSVLVVDDDEQVVQATVLLLRQWGCTAHGTSHLETWLNDPAHADFQPDVALIDNDEDSQHDALAVAGTVSGHWPAAGILLITGQADAPTLERMRASGYPLLEKPVNPQDLHEVLVMFQHLN